MLKDIERGSDPEIGAIGAAIVRAARRHALHVPVMRDLVERVRVVTLQRKVLRVSLIRDTNLKTLGECASRMRTNARIIRSIVQLFPEDAALARVSGDDFSMTEHVCHLRDLEKDGFRPRITAMLTSQRPQLFDFDGAAVARSSNYTAQDPWNALSAFVHYRDRNVALLRGAPADAIQREGFYEPGRPITLLEVLEGVLAHDEDHMSRLGSLLANLKHQV